MATSTFNEKFRKRTKQLALDILKFYGGLKKNDELRIMGKQLIRCVTSVGANFRAVCLAGSPNEKYSKYCIVVEEADETIYWIELFDECHLDIQVPSSIKSEAIEIIKVMITCKTNLKQKLGK